MGDDETPLRISVLSGLLLLIAIADYRTLFNSSDKILCCVPSPGLRVIHRSTLQEAIEERAGERNKERPENKSEEQNKKNPEEQGSKRTEEDDKENEKLEDQDKEKAERQEKENTTEEVK